MTKNAPDDRDELEATAENPPTPETNPRQNTPDDPTRLEESGEIGQNGNKHRTDGGSRDAIPGGDGRKGLFKTVLDRPEEVHALVVGAAVGAMAARTGNVNAIAAIIGAGALGSRLQIGLPDKYLKQAKQELPYAIAGIAIGYFGTQLLQRNELSGFV